MQTEPAFLDDLIRATWNGKISWNSIKVNDRLGYSAEFEGSNIRTFTTFRDYEVSPGGIIRETDYWVQKQARFLNYKELDAPRAWKRELSTAISFKAWEISSAQSAFLKEQGYLIRFSGRDPRGQNLFYQEPNRYLIIWIDIPTHSGARWSASTKSLRTWTDPVDKDIEPEKQLEVISRIGAWSESMNALVRFEG